MQRTRWMLVALLVACVSPSCGSAEPEATPVVLSCNEALDAWGAMVLDALSHGGPCAADTDCTTQPFDISCPYGLSTDSCVNVVSTRGLFDTLESLEWQERALCAVPSEACRVLMGCTGTVPICEGGTCSYGFDYREPTCRDALAELEAIVRDAYARNASCRTDQDCALRSESRKCHDGATLELCPLPLAANATEAVLADLRKYDFDYFCGRHHSACTNLQECPPATPACVDGTCVARPSAQPEGCQFVTVSETIGEKCLVPWDEVVWDLEPAPIGEPSDGSYWTPTWCTTATPSGSASDLCPAIAEQFGCRSVYALDEIGAWLHEDVTPLVCVVCDADGRDGEPPCACDQGLTYHQAGLGGVMCDRLLVVSGVVPEVIDSADGLWNYALPPYTPEAALAYVELLEPRVHHAFSDYVGNPTKVASWLDIEQVGCTKATLPGTTVTATGEPTADFTEGTWIVSTYRYPDWNGCTDVTLEHVVYRVWTSYGEVGIDPYVVEPVCFGHVACED